MSDTIKEFIDGQRDCNEGIQPQHAGCEAYMDGYSFEYQLQECKSNQGAR